MKLSSRSRGAERVSWDERVARVLRRANALSAENGEVCFPILMRRLVKACGVSNVIFKPMLYDGGLKPAGSGFAILVKCEEKYCAMASEFFNEERLGHTLNVRMRFTIAHELAHTFFYEYPKYGLPRIFSWARAK